MGTRYMDRIAHIEQLLLIENKVIDTVRLREACSYGIPEQLRPLCWRLFLNYLPHERASWVPILRKRRAEYADLVDNLIVQAVNLDDEDSTGNAIDESLDHPLASNSGSKWVKFFDDNDVLIQIDRDVRRLRPEINFFQQNTNYPITKAARINMAKRISQDRLVSDDDQNGMTNSSFLSASQDGVPGPSETEAHWQVVERILFIYSKVNPGVKYVQGMNEVVGPIYYVLATDPDKEWAEHAEADTFYCFQQLMSEIKDNFIKTLDTSNCGIEIVLNTFHEHFSAVDPALYNRLVVVQGIKPQYYAFRWILLLLSQEFSLPDLINLWDYIFSTTDRVQAAQYVCLGMIRYLKDDLMEGDFSVNVRLLQNFPDIDVGLLINMAHELEDAAGKGMKAKSMSLRSTSSRSSDASTSEVGSLANLSSSAAAKAQIFTKDSFSALVSGAKAKLSSYTAGRKASATTAAAAQDSSG